MWMVHLLGGYVVSMSVLEFLSKDLPEGPDTRLTHTHTLSLSVSVSKRGSACGGRGVEWSCSLPFGALLASRSVTLRPPLPLWGGACWAGLSHWSRKHIEGKDLF